MPWFILVIFSGFLISCGTTVYESDHRTQEITYCPRHQVSKESIETLSKEVESHFPFKIGHTQDLCTSSEIACEEIPENEFSILELTLSQTQREFAKYASDALTHSGLKTVIFMKRLSLKGKTVGGIAVGSQLFINTHVNNCSLLGFQETLQHEFFHIIDSQLLRTDDKKTAWSGLNTEGFQYTGYEKGLAFSPTLSHEYLGFVSQYAQTALEEDRAELFKSLAIGLHARRVEEWQKADSALAHKIAHLKKELQTKEPTFNAEFWKKCKESD